MIKKYIVSDARKLIQFINTEICEEYEILDNVSSKQIVAVRISLDSEDKAIKRYIIEAGIEVN